MITCYVIIDHDQIAACEYYSFQCRFLVTYLRASATAISFLVKEHNEIVYYLLSFPASLTTNDIA